MHDCVNAYYAPDKMIRAEEKDGKYEFVDDGRHRLAAAQELGYDVPVQNVSKPCMENANSDFERQSEQSRISQPDYSAEQDAQANNILSERENYLNPDQPYNYVDSDGYEPAKVLGGSGNNYESKQAQAEKDYYESCVNPPASNEPNSPENTEMPQNDNGDEKSSYLSGYEASQVLDNPNHYTDSENENNGGEIESEPDKLNAQKQVGDYEPSQEQEQPETLNTENDSEQSSGQKPPQEQEQPETLDTENGSEQSSGQKPSQEQEQPETLDTENGNEQSSGQKPSQEQEQPETLDTENDSEQSNGQKPSEEENAQNDMQAGGNGSTSDSASNNSSSKSNEMDNNNSKDNAQDSGAPAVSAADDVPEQSGGMSM